MVRYDVLLPGHFTQEDPIGLAGGLNLYGYANADPINYSDPFGLNPCKGAASLVTVATAAAVDGPIPVGDFAAAVCLAAARAHSVYTAVQGGITRYAGITTDLARRAGEHLTQKGISIKAIPGLSKLSKVEVRAVEQLLMERFGLGKDGGSLLNRINSISPKRDIYDEAIERGTELLRSVGFPGF